MQSNPSTCSIVASASSSVQRSFGGYPAQFLGSEVAHEVTGWQVARLGAPLRYRRVGEAACPRSLEVVRAPHLDDPSGAHRRTKSGSRRYAPSAPSRTAAPPRLGTTATRTYVEVSGVSDRLEAARCRGELAGRQRARQIWRGSFGERLWRRVACLGSSRMGERRGRSMCGRGRR